MSFEIIGSKDCEKFLNFARKFDFFLIAGHKNPDGDCIASALVIKNLLERLKKTTFLLSAGPFVRTEIQKFAPFFENVAPSFAKSAKVAVILEDCSEISRIGDALAAQLEKYPRFCIDHHKTAEVDSANSIVRPDSPATAYLTQILYEKILGELPSDVAKTAFFGIATDSGFFRFLTQKDAPVFLAAAQLVKAGTSPNEIYRQISGGKTFESRVLLGILLARAECFFDGKLIVTWETEEETKKFGRKNRDSDTVYDLLLSCQNVDAVALIRRDEGKCAVGLRSQGDFDVSKIAQVFGGGGHKNASGLSAEMQIDEMKSALLSEFEKAFR